MHNLVPAFITSQLAKGNKNGAYPAVGLFVDLTGFSSMTTALMELGQHGAETLAALMRGLFDPMIDCVYEHGGLISTFSGDAFTALFTIEGSAEETCLQAVHCAASILEDIARNRVHRTASRV